MNYGSLFSGIGGVDLALERAGFECAWQCEIDKSCQTVLKKHFSARIYDDVRSISRDNTETVDLICGGFPCQDLSIAGKREGLAGERSGLWFEFHRIITELKPRWVVIENVPGLLSSNGGKDFAIILRGLVECGYGVSWRVLDAQYFGVAQRRRRVFIVGSLGNGRSAEVLFERESGSGDTAPSRETGQGVAHAISASPTETGRLDPNGQDFIIGFHDSGPNHKRQDRPNGGLYVKETETSLTLGSTDQTVISFIPGQSAAARSLGESYDLSVTVKGDGGGTKPHIAVWHNHQQSGEIRIQDDSLPTVSRQWGTGGNNVPFVGVRRLTPTECERLQGFPDGWTDGQSDSARYRQLGNAVAVPVVEWIVKRIKEAQLQIRMEI